MVSSAVGWPPVCMGLLFRSPRGLGKRHQAWRVHFHAMATVVLSSQLLDYHGYYGRENISLLAAR